jgi:hypothetical protein
MRADRLRAPSERTHLVRSASEWKNGRRGGESPPLKRPPPLLDIDVPAMGYGAEVARERREFLAGVGGFFAAEGSRVSELNSTPRPG